MPVEFLREQMAWREELDDAGSRAEVDAARPRARERAAPRLERLADALDERARLRRGRQEVSALMFIERFARPRGSPDALED